MLWFCSVRLWICSRNSFVGSFLFLGDRNSYVVSVHCSWVRVLSTVLPCESQENSGFYSVSCSFGGCQKLGINLKIKLFSRTKFILFDGCKFMERFRVLVGFDLLICKKPSWRVIVKSDQTFESWLEEENATPGCPCFSFRPSSPRGPLQFIILLIRLHSNICNVTLISAIALPFSFCYEQYLQLFSVSPRLTACTEWCFKKAGLVYYNNQS